MPQTGHWYILPVCGLQGVYKFCATGATGAIGAIGATGATGAGDIDRCGGKWLVLK